MTPTPGPLSRFLRYTTQDEPALTVGVVAAFVLYAIDRYLHLTDDDLQLIGLLLVPIVGAVLTRFNVYSPATHEREVADALNESDPQQGGA